MAESSQFTMQVLLISSIDIGLTTSVLKLNIGFVSEQVNL